MTQNPLASKVVKFPRPQSQSFSKVLRQRVHQYFKETNQSTNANAAMKWKTVIMLSLYFGPYTALLLTNPGGVWVFLAFAFMGLSMAGIGMSVMHDAAHGAYHKNNAINRLLSSSIYLISGNATTWKLQHNVLHHTFTNIEGLDEDLETRGLLRLHPSQPWKKMHRFQMWYAPLLYGILTLNWVVMKDFSQLIRYRKLGVAKFSDQELRREWAILIFTKALYFFLFLALPIMVLSVSWWVILLAFVVMHFIAGSVLSFVFQLAHVVKNVDTLDAPESGEMEDAFLEHQIRTTANFSRHSKFLNWYVGGLNFQVEHHLFPNICHIHYPKLSKIVKQTAEEFGLPYHDNPSFFGAIKEHMRSLKAYAQPPLAGA
jgi:linoleoyl-CoA desaturase